MSNRSRSKAHRRRRRAAVHHGPTPSTRTVFYDIGFSGIGALVMFGVVIIAMPVVAAIIYQYAGDANAMSGTYTFHESVEPGFLVTLLGGAMVVLGGVLGLIDARSHAGRVHRRLS